MAAKIKKTNKTQPPKVATSVKQARVTRKASTPRPKTPPMPKSPKAPFKFTKNIVPPVLGILVFLGVLGLLNGQWIQAQVEYRFTKPAAAVEVSIDTSAPSQASQIIIPKINVTAPVVFDEPSFDDAKVQLALRRGPVHYGDTASPGEKGNAVIVGHSSGALWAPGNYKFVFTLLEKLEKGDRYIIDYKGTRYIYQVSSTETIQPENLTVLNQGSTPTATLITCTPVGTSQKRFVVHADQISPKPETAATNSVSAAPITTGALPGSAQKSLWRSFTALF